MITEIIIISHGQTEPVQDKKKKHVSDGDSIKKEKGRTIANK